MGLAATELFVAEGAKVVVADIQADKGPALEKRFPGKVRFSRCDIRSEEDVMAAISLATQTFGGLDIMYHNAGAAGTKEDIGKITLAGWDDTMNLLLRSAVLFLKHALEPIKARGGGAMILTSSAAAVNLGPAVSAYTVAKSGVLTLGRVAALEFAPHKIRVNVIIPGATPTAIFGNLVGASQDVSDRMGKYLQDAFAKMQPLPRAGAPEDVARAALFLASDDSGFITGAALPVDGGLCLNRPSAGAFLFDALNKAKDLATKEIESA
jgi:NAD(P)-dependent dehydrogenase (short-subunit alcohol dehydrogenase family)